MELLLKRNLAYDYINFISKSFTDKATRDKLKLAAHYFLCDYGQSELEPRKSCEQCKDNNVEISRLECGMKAQEICKAVLEFIIMSNQEAKGPYRPILQHCLKIQSEHIQNNIYHEDSCFEPAYFLTPIQFESTTMLRSCKITNSKANSGNKYPTSLVTNDGEYVKIPLRIIDDKYEALDPRLVSKIFDV